MTAHDIDLEIEKQAVLAGSRELSARWTIEISEHRDLSDKELQKKIEETYDRWTWETGSDEDKNLLEELEDERDSRPNIYFSEELIDELTESMAKEIKDEIDQEILGKLKRYRND